MRINTSAITTAQIVFDNNSLPIFGSTVSSRRNSFFVSGKSSMSAPFTAFAKSSGFSPAARIMYSVSLTPSAWICACPLPILARVPLISAVDTGSSNLTCSRAPPVKSIPKFGPFMKISRNDIPMTIAEKIKPILLLPMKSIFEFRTISIIVRSSTYVRQICR